MTAEMAAPLSASLEDYLAVIFWIVAGKGAARTRDIAERLQVKASSVTSALQLLAQRQYVNYKPYEPVILTHEGFDQAAKVVQRHRVLRDFLVQILGVDDATAEKAACRLEHEIPGAVAQRLVEFSDYVKDLPPRARRLVEAFAERRQTAARDEDWLYPGQTTVANLKIGREAVIAAVKGRSQVARRLADMGLGRGALVTVEAVAPMGDPIRVKVRGYRLALRRHEAEGIVVVEG